MEYLDRVRGAMLGLAIGDALGHPTEFVPSVPAIRARWGPLGVTTFERAGRHPSGSFTDDTQMTIAVARALCRAGHRDLDALMTTMGEEFVAWSRSSLNNRAPGGTCLAGCRAFARGAPWREAGVKGSKGCGAAMRAAPVGLFHPHDVEALVRVAAAQSALTHAHPTGIASGVAAAAAVAWVARGESVEAVIAFTRSCVERLDLAALVGVGCDPRVAEHIGVTEMLEALDRTERALSDDHEDVCALLGGAWVGEEAVACGLWCALKSPGDFSTAVLRGANSSGDSDSIACIAGSVLGAALGAPALPERWRAEVEWADGLTALADALEAARASGVDVALDKGLDVFGVERLGVRPEDLDGEHDTLTDDSLLDVLHAGRGPAAR